jgi:hypothetical protein
MKHTLLLFIVLPIAFAYSAAQVATPIQVGLVPKEKVIVAGQPLAVTLELKSSSLLRFDLGANHTANLRFTINGPTGRKIESQLPTPDFTVPGMITLSPGMTYLQTINLAPILKAEVPGLYQVGVEIVGNPNVIFKVDSEIPANILVNPKDSEQLRLACEELGRRIEVASSSSDRLEAASELASIRDPVAVPTIQKLLRHGLSIDSELINSLAEIGNADAIEVLRSSATGPDPDLVLLSRSALLRIKSRTSDEGLRKLADEALQPKQATTR